MSYWTGRTVIVLGGTGFLGTRLTAMLKETTARLVVPLGTKHLDLRQPNALKMSCFELGLKPDIVFHLAANVGGIGATSQYPVDFLYDNTLMGLEVVKQCYEMDIDKLIVAGSVCAYPEHCPVPMVEENLWEGYPERTNGAYGTAKRTVLVAQQAYHKQYDFPSAHVLMANLYGPGQSFDIARSHVIPAIITKVKVAMDLGRESIELWGSGTASRDFLYVDDAAHAYIAIAETYHSPEPVNIGSGEEIMIAPLTHLICELMGFEGNITWDLTKPDGQPRRCLRIWHAEDTTGWHPTTSLKDGLAKTIEHYLANL